MQSWDPSNDEEDARQTVEVDTNWWSQGAAFFPEATQQASSIDKNIGLMMVALHGHDEGSSVNARSPFFPFLNIIVSIVIVFTTRVFVDVNIIGTLIYKP